MQTVKTCYLAKKEIESVEKTGETYAYTFKGSNNTSTTKRKNKIAKIIYKNIKKSLEKNQQTNVAQIVDVLTKESYEKDDCIDIPLVKEKIKFTKLTSANLGDKVYIVVETEHIDAGRKIKMNFKQGGDTKVVTDVQEPIYVTQNGKTNFLFTAIVGEFSEQDTVANAKDFENYAIAKVTLGSTNEDTNKKYKEALNKAEGKKTPFYISMDAEPEGDQNWYEVFYEEVFGGKANLWYYGEGNWFELKTSTVLEYSIHYNGNIEKNNIKEPKEVIYNYFDSKGGKHILGESELIEVDKWKKKGKKTSPITKVLLVDARNIDKYVSGNIKFKILVWNTKKRFYISPDCFSSLLGAMIEESIEDLSFNGFSEKDGSPGGSSTHLNGVAGDLRYLSTNKNGELILLEQNDFDYDRQVKFNKALYKFGWGRSKKMLSENFNRVTGTKEVVNPKTKKKEIIKVITKTLLPHTQHYKKKKKNGKWVRHNNHLHIYGFNFSIIKKK